MSCLAYSDDAPVLEALKFIKLRRRKKMRRNKKFFICLPFTYLLRVCVTETLVRWTPLPSTHTYTLYIEFGGGNKTGRLKIKVKAVLKAEIASGFKLWHRLLIGEHFTARHSLVLPQLRLVMRKKRKKLQKSQRQRVQVFGCCWHICEYYSILLSSPCSLQKSVLLWQSAPALDHFPPHTPTFQPDTCLPQVLSTFLRSSHEILSTPLVFFIFFSPRALSLSLFARVILFHPSIVHPLTLPSSCFFCAVGIPTSHYQVTEFELQETRFDGSFLVRWRAELHPCLDWRSFLFKGISNHRWFLVHY